MWHWRALVGTGTKSPSTVKWTIATTLWRQHGACFLLPPGSSEVLLLRVDTIKWSQTFRNIESVILFHPQVPQLYKIRGYQPFSVQLPSASYRPQKLARALKQGAEVTHPRFGNCPHLSPLVPASRFTLLLVLSQDEATTVIALPKQDVTPQSPGKISILNMKPPKALAVSPDYDPLYIFVSDHWQKFCVLCSFISAVAL